MYNIRIIFLYAYKSGLNVALTVGIWCARSRTSSSIPERKKIFVWYRQIITHHDSFFTSAHGPCPKQRDNYLINPLLHFWCIFWCILRNSNKNFDDHPPRMMTRALPELTFVKTKALHLEIKYVRGTITSLFWGTTATSNYTAQIS